MKDPEARRAFAAAFPAVSYSQDVRSFLRISPLVDSFFKKHIQACNRMGK